MRELKPLATKTALKVDHVITYGRSVDLKLFKLKIRLTLIALGVSLPATVKVITPDNVRIFNIKGD